MKKKLVIGIIIAVIVVIGVILILMFTPESKNENNAASQNCIDSGGKVTTIDCYCPNSKDFMNNCLIGGCSCSPSSGYIKAVKSCECESGKCFDGNSCISR